MGCALLRGTWCEIARAAFNVNEIQQELIQLTLRKLASECSALVSRKAPSILRNTSSEEIAKLSLEAVCHEWKNQAPLLYAMLMTVASPKHAKLNSKRDAKSLPIKNDSKEPDDWLPSVAVAGSVLLKQRSRYMNGVQLMLMMLMKYSGFQVI